jgi:hypothetical protein
MRQTHQNFSHPRSADVEDVCKPLLDQLGARVQAVFQNGGVDLFVNLIV